MTDNKVKLEPSAKSRKFSRYVADQFQALLDQGFTREEALLITVRLNWEQWDEEKGWD